MIAATGSTVGSINHGEYDMTISEFAALLPIYGWVIIGLSTITAVLVLRWLMKRQERKYRFRGPF